MEFKDKIKRQRQLLKLTLKEVADKVGVSEATIQRYESGEIKNVRRDKILALANALEVTPAYLMGWEELEDGSYLISEKHHSYSTNSNLIKVYGKICAGDGKTAYEDIIDEIICPYPRIRGNLIALKVDGDSMNKVIRKGDYAILKVQPTVENGQIAAVIIENEDAMLKRFYRLDDETVVLKPESTEDYQAITFMGNDINKIRVLGKFIGYVSPYVE